MNEIVVIDYGVGNLLSVKRGLEYCGAKAIITSKPEDIINATKIILPGVGAFKNAMQSLESLGLVKAIQEVANRKINLLGIGTQTNALLQFAAQPHASVLGLPNCFAVRQPVCNALCDNFRQRTIKGVSLLGCV